ncbi:MAG: hypothetical protein V3V20_00370 [Algisphaera sp.]
MEHTLKLTITAVGENGSVFLTPCDPVTLHESAIERPEGADAEGDDQESVLCDDVLAINPDEELMVLVDEA